MNYNEACNILGVNDNDTLEDIKKKYRELARMYHPDTNNSKDATKKMQQINAAFEFLSENFNSKSYTLSYEEFVQKYKANAKIICYMQIINIDFRKLYDMYTNYVNSCISVNTKYRDLFSWLQDFESAKTYADIIASDNIYYIYSNYIKSKNISTETFKEYTLAYLTIRINDTKFCNITPAQLKVFLKEYINYLQMGNNINFNEWLDQKIIGYSIERVQRNINKIIISGNFNGITDGDVYEILIFITGKTIFDDRYYPPKNINTFKLIFTYAAKQNSNIIFLSNMLNSNIETLIEAYFNSKYRYSATFNDYLVALSKIALDEKSDNVDNVNRMVREMSYSKKQI